MNKPSTSIEVLLNMKQRNFSNSNHLKFLRQELAGPDKTVQNSLESRAKRTLPHSYTRLSPRGGTFITMFQMQLPTMAGNSSLGGQHKTSNNQNMKHLTQTLRVSLPAIPTPFETSFVPAAASG